MGTFTGVYHPDDGRELQIYSGNGSDICQRYKLGDTVDWCIDPYMAKAGKLLDGVYSSQSHVNGVDDFVIIKDHKIHAIIPLIRCGDGCDFEVDEDGDCGHNNVITIAKQFDIQSLPDSAWSEESWNNYWKSHWNRVSRFEDISIEFIIENINLLNYDLLLQNRRLNKTKIKQIYKMYGDLI